MVRNPLEKLKGKETGSIWGRQVYNFKLSDQRRPY